MSLCKEQLPVAARFIPSVKCYQINVSVHVHTELNQLTLLLANSCLFVYSH